MTSESINSGELRQPESNLTIRRRRLPPCYSRRLCQGRWTGCLPWKDRRQALSSTKDRRAPFKRRQWQYSKIFTCMPSCWQLSPRAFVRASDHWEFFGTERMLLSGCPLFRWKTAALKKDNFARFGDVKILLKIFNPIICKKFNCTCSRTWACRSEPWTSGLWEPAYDPCQRGQGGRARNIISDLSKISSQSF